MVKVVCASIKSGPMYGHKFFVKTNAPVLIGRDANANIRITNDEFCSRKHAILTWESNACYIQDMGSVNGTRVNGSKINGKIRLNNKDKIYIGDTEILISVSEHSEKRRRLF